MRRRAEIAFLVLVATASAFLSTSCSRSDGSAATTTVPVTSEPETWLAAACGVFTDVAEIQSKPLLPPDSNVSLDSQADRQQVRASLVAELAQRREAVEALAEQFTKAGVPTSRGGSTLAEDIQRGLSQVSERYRRVGGRVAEVPAGDAELYQAQLQSALAALDQQADLLQAARDSVVADPAMSELVPSTKACTEL